MKRQDRAALVASTLTSTIGEILEEEQLDVGEALAVMQLVARSLQASVDAQNLLSIERYKGMPYLLSNGGGNGE